MKPISNSTTELILSNPFSVIINDQSLDFLMKFSGTGGNASQVFEREKGKQKRNRSLVTVIITRFCFPELDQCIDTFDEGADLSDKNQLALLHGGNLEANFAPYRCKP
jgi:hypothetical protein